MRSVEGGQKIKEHSDKESKELIACHWPDRLSSVFLCCPGANPTNTTSFLKWPIPEKGSTRSRPPSSSANEGSTWANTVAALKRNIHTNMHNTHANSRLNARSRSPSYYIILWLELTQSSVWCRLLHTDTATEWDEIYVRMSFSFLKTGIFFNLTDKAFSKLSNSNRT